jgi:hypothetical protein
MIVPLFVIAHLHIFLTTRQRDAAFAALEAWMRDFVKVARVALKGRPQLLAQLGLTPQTRRHGRVAEPAATVARGVPDASIPVPAHAVAPAAGEQAAPPRRNGRTTLSEQKA